jgi:hypothetical protein
MNHEIKVKEKPRNSVIYAGLVSATVLALFALADYTFIGEVLIGVYALFAFWRLDSAQVFKLAMVSLGVMLVGLVLGRVEVIDSFSSYAFLLFLVGLFVLGRELWRYSQELRLQREEEPRS